MPPKKVARAWIEVDIDESRAAYQRACDFVEACDLRYGFSSKELSKLGGSEKAGLMDLYEADYDWGGKGRIQLSPPEFERITFALNLDAAPNACENFTSLCVGDKGKAKGSGAPLHYKTVPFHRIMPGAIVQGGDFATRNGSGGESIWGGKFKDEKGGLKLKHDKRGILSMCNSGKNSNGSQFFMCFSPQKALMGSM